MVHRTRTIERGKFVNGIYSTLTRIVPYLYIQTGFHVSHMGTSTREDGPQRVGEDFNEGNVLAR